MGGVPTTKPRYTFTDSGHLKTLLDAAQETWPETTDRKVLLLRLVEQGHEALESREEELAAEERCARARTALERIPSLVDREVLLSDRAWN
jgi:hypothetical protein